MSERSTEFVALGHAGSGHYAGLETFENPGVARVELTSDELVAVCPITNQPDMYVATIEYDPDALCLESKSLKLYLASFRNEGAFFQTHPDTPGKLAAFARAFEHLEIGGYEQLKRVAERAGDDETAALAERVLAQEREAAERIAGAFDQALTASLEEVGAR